MKIMVWMEGLAACYCFVLFGLAIHNWILAQTQTLPPTHQPTKWELVELLAAYMIRPRGLTTSSLVLAKGAGRGNLCWKLTVDQ
jgi:hypothetical protein